MRRQSRVFPTESISATRLLSCEDELKHLFFLECVREKHVDGQEDGCCAKAGWWGGGDWRPGVVISSVQRTTCLCLRDAALPPAKDSVRVKRAGEMNNRIKNPTRSREGRLLFTDSNLEDPAI
ncbi:hypothetical protein EYF80_003789 [Liparis tanakae]|uniref:Uncharacterized protein n=1 Tax=Liparis tanakae TaxID=230148 RepID=A0A4Z2J6D2_9TELE|nr:hypothetical protein EYF80_003789 [Liparis tanakae]